MEVDEAFAKMVADLEIEMEWEKQHGSTDKSKSFSEGRLSGLATAKRIVCMMARRCERENALN